MIFEFIVKVSRIMRLNVMSLMESDKVVEAGSSRVGECQLGILPKIIAAAALPSHVGRYPANHNGQETKLAVVLGATLLMSTPSCSGSSFIHRRDNV